MKICIIARTWFTSTKGAAERYLMELFNRFKKKYEVKVITLDEGDGEDIIRINLPKNLLITPILFSFLASKRATRLHPDICLIGQYWAEFSGLMLKIPWIPIIPDVSLFQSKRMQAQRLRYFIRTNLLCKVMHKAKRIIVHLAVTASDLQEYLNIPFQKICVIKPGIYLNNSSIPHEGTNILCVGKITYYKGQHIMLTAFKHIKKKYPTSKLFLVGRVFDQKYYGQLLKTIQIHHIKDVHFIGDVSDNELEQYYASADICVQLALDILTGGLAVMEAFAHQKAVICSESLFRLGIANKDRALIVEKNSVGELMKNIELLIEKEELRNNLAKNGYNFAKEFTWEKTAEKVEAEIQNCLVNYPPIN